MLLFFNSSATFEESALGRGLYSACTGSIYDWLLWGGSQVVYSHCRAVQLIHCVSLAVLVAQLRLAPSCAFSLFFVTDMQLLDILFFQAISS